MTSTTGTGVSPILDIGGDVGAIVVRLSKIPASGELHACSPDGLTRFHTGVHPLAADAGDGVVAVFPQVRAGDYVVLDEADSSTAEVRVVGGAVTEVDLRDGADPTESQVAT